MLAANDVPSSTSIFSQFTGAELPLNLSCDLFVEVVLLVGGLADYKTKNG